jgi:peptidoglycan/xylan/chitin deacetylase (PgdA/CDA1 family)
MPMLLVHCKSWLRRTTKLSALHLAKWMGLFRLARRATAGRLRILCFHGLALDDEHRFRPGLFMRPEVLRKRLRTLHAKKYPVLPLGEAIERLSNGTLPPCATVVTFDDGFYSFSRHAVEILQEFSFPATVYVTTYYVAKRTPIFRLVVKYLFWKSTCKSLELDGLGMDRTGLVDLSRADAKEKAAKAIIAFGESRLNDEERCGLAGRLAARLGLDYDKLAASRTLSLMTTEELRRAAEAGIDIQLHTHRHRFPVDRDVVQREIEDNRSFLEALLKRPAQHFCYPCGIWSQAHWPWLEAAGVRSATTCESGLNDRQTPKFGLNRFLDSESRTQIEFESELSGFAELLHSITRRIPKDTRPGVIRAAPATSRPC